ncbi:MAG TPA: ABC transporter permease [Planctomycetota bacterium]|jgi:molybdate transport system permease protein
MSVDTEPASSVVAASRQDTWRPASDVPFWVVLGTISGLYILLIVALLLADTCFTSFGWIAEALRSPEIRYAILLTLISCTITAFLSLLVAVPLGYLLARKFSGQSNGLAFASLNGVLDTILDIPIVLPPLVIGLSLLILFRYVPEFINRRVVYEIPAVILAQFTVSCAFAVRTMRITFDQINPRCEQVALTLGCNRAQAFWHVVLPQARRGILAAGTLAWARALGEFGPILVFAGATRMRTEVLSTTVFLELSIGRIEVAVAVSLLMIFAALVALVTARFLGLRDPAMRATTL